MSGPTAGPEGRGVLHLVVPATVEDPARPSGGNVYDVEVARALRSRGERVGMHPVPAVHLGRALAGLPDGALVLVDGLLGLDAPQVLQRESGRLRLWLLVHLPLALAARDDAGVRARERRSLATVTGVIVTSGWTRGWLVGAYGLDPARVRVARPGVRPARTADATPDPGALLCLASVTPVKGQDVLVTALAGLRDLSWSCRLAGPLDRDPAFVGRLREQVRRAGLGRRVDLVGALPTPAADAALRSAGLLVLPSRLETYGMVVTEALARGVPVLATDAGGVAEALGSPPGGPVPGALVPPGDAPALAAALRRWLEDPSWRRELRAAARARRDSLPRWSGTADSILRALRDPPLNPVAGSNVVRA